MAKLLVSIRSPAEAVDALAGGADIIDVKEPNRGSLGRADDETILAILNVIKDRVPVSMACGELPDWRPSDHCPQVGFAKIGLSGCRENGSQQARFAPSWQRRWRQWAAALPPATKPIAVVYADALAAGSPHALDIIGAGQQIGCAGVLVDTFCKQPSRSLLEITSPTEITRWINAARQTNQFIALAGSLTVASMPVIVPLNVDIIAVRGAACTDHRTGQINEQKVRRLSNILSPPSNRQHGTGERHQPTPSECSHPRFQFPQNA